ncbi:hypothetical protein GCM10009840_13920 [Pseudolysinimonas kribbensis]|uniref:CTP synthase n=1 Tax=Pseudolysinimonas kribbensis TaxID=433641 RepID=A0ABQ6K4D1_9MICO|nr:hypothetical protein [Pseudolysinimonas kribbensis]GMA94299.1 CTP synthase [Pseudolysinimonas kribbensis]
MLDMVPSEWRWRLLLARDARTESARRRLAERAKAGELVRVVRGAYLPQDDWTSLDAEERYGMRIRAICATHPGIVLAHGAAAAAWGLPWIGPRASRFDVLTEGRAGSTSNIRRRIEPRGEVVTIDGMLVTGLARTVVDVARDGDLSRAVAVADAALNPRTRAQLAVRTGAPDLESELARVPFRHGEVRARHVVDFADGRSGSAGESASRVTIDRIGLPSAILQQPFPRSAGGCWLVDFWWPEFGLIGEFDGRQKYLDPAFRDGRSADEVVYDEKRREDELRRQCRAFVRWGWREARNPASLAALLRSVGAH